MKKMDFNDLKKDVVDAGLCNGCGACSGFCPTSAIIHNGDECEPSLAGECKPCGICYKICGGKNIPLPELEENIFGRQRDLGHPFEYWLGVFKKCLAGHSTDERLRKRGDSGAVTSGLIKFALETAHIEVALLTGMDEDKPWMAAPLKVTNLDGVLASQQSKYQMSPTLSLLTDLAKNYERIGVVGLPCQIWPIKKALNVPGARKIAKKVVLTIGIFCAAQYYRKATEHLIQEWCGIQNIEDVVNLQYRGGDWPGSFVVSTRDGKHFSFAQHEYKYHHLIPYYQRDRCTMCLDYSSDLADISVGDIWTLSEPGELGWNAILVRTDKGEKVVTQAEMQEYIYTKDLDPDLVLYGTVGLKSKLVSNSYRFANRVRFGWPVPDYGYEPTGFRRPLIGKKAIWSKG